MSTFSGIAIRDEARVPRQCEGSPSEILFRTRLEGSHSAQGAIVSSAHVASLVGKYLDAAKVRKEQLPISLCLVSNFLLIFSGCQTVMENN